MNYTKLKLQADILAKDLCLQAGVNERLMKQQLHLLNLIKKGRTSNLSRLNHEKYRAAFLALLRKFDLQYDSNGVIGDFVDLLQEVFPKLLYESCLGYKNQHKHPVYHQDHRDKVMIKNTPDDIFQRLSQQCQRTIFTRGLLQDYHRQSMKTPKELHFFINVNSLRRLEINDYLLKSSRNARKFANLKLKGSFKNLVYAIFGYGRVFRAFYGSTHTKLATALTPLALASTPKRSLTPRTDGTTSISSSSNGSRRSRTPSPASRTSSAIPPNSFEPNNLVVAATTSAELQPSPPRTPQRRTPLIDSPGYLPQNDNYSSIPSPATLGNVGPMDKSSARSETRLGPSQVTYNSPAFQSLITPLPRGRTENSESPIASPPKFADPNSPPASPAAFGNRAVHTTISYDSSALVTGDPTSGSPPASPAAFDGTTSESPLPLTVFE